MCSCKQRISVLLLVTNHSLNLHSSSFLIRVLLKEETSPPHFANPFAVAVGKKLRLRSSGLRLMLDLREVDKYLVQFSL